MRFSIITPAYQMGPWIARTIESVLSQEGDFEIEYIVVARESSDDTVAIAQSYAQRIADKSYPSRCNGITMRIRIQNEGGMYGAINTGFSEASGDVYAWINADDTYQPGAFRAIATALAAFPDIEWLKGITDTIDGTWHTTRAGTCKAYRQDWLQKGIYGREAYFIEQDSCFWRSSLWKRAGPIPSSYRSAGDYWLWISFARFAPLWSLNVPVSNFMKREGQLSRVMDDYKQEQLQARPSRPLAAWLARLFFLPRAMLGARLEGFFIWLYPKIFFRDAPSYIAISDGVASAHRARSFIV